MGLDSLKIVEGGKNESPTINLASQAQVSWMSPLTTIYDFCMV
jgi:hypothetical protein